MKKYELKSSTYLSQFRSLRELALSLLDKYDLKVGRLDFLHHGHNTTFKVITHSSEKYLLRICCDGYHSTESIEEDNV